MYGESQGEDEERKKQMRLLKKQGKAKENDT